MSDDGIYGTSGFEQRMAVVASRIETAVQVEKVEREKATLFRVLNGRAIRSGIELQPSDPKAWSPWRGSRGRRA